MANRRDPNSVDVARARVALAAGDAPSRTSRRRNGLAPGFAGVDTAVLLAAADPKRRAAVVARAAAAAHGHEIARAIDAAARAEIVDTLGPDARTFGLAHRHLSCAPAGGGALADRLTDTRSAADLALNAHLSGAPLDATPLGACLFAALSSGAPK
ncbi:MAG: hypothetical protein AAGA87_02490 [Pseudomonadota bacterium]